jgi:hypothetical protein
MNSAGTDGGGVCGSAILTSCTVTANSAQGDGGGVYGSGILTNCTISGNSAWGDGDGVYGGGTLTNCIVWDNAGGSVLGEHITYSCIEGETVWPGNGNINLDPLFVQPGRWEDCGAGGQPGCVYYEWNPDTGEITAWHRWVSDYHLQPGSPATDAGTSEGAPATDIDGTPRPCWNGIDMGAYEYCGETPPVHTQQFRRGDANGDGATDISDAIAILRYLFLGLSKVPCEQAADANDDGVLDASDAMYELIFLFQGGQPIEPPVGACGADPTRHSLLCRSFPPCQ